MEERKVIAIKLIRLFIGFLKNENILDEYMHDSELGITNWHSDRNSNTFVINTAIQSKILIIEKAHCFISNAFTWRRTEEGHEFWEDINSKWYALLGGYIKNL